MKKLLAIVLSSALLLSCSKPIVSDLGKNTKTQNISELPEWVVSPDSDVKEGVAGVGIASPSVGNIKFQIPQAEIDAKANIASTINSEISRITKGLQKPVIRVGNLDSVRSVIDVRDCVNAYYLLMKKAKPGEAYNVGGESTHSIGEILDIMLELRGLKGRVKKQIDEKLWRPIDINIQIPDSRKCHKLTGWSPNIPLRQTLSDLLDYWDKKIESEKKKSKKK